MDLIRRATQGRLSEIFGKKLVKTDLMLRALNISQKSDKVYKTLSPQIKNCLDAYADGVNQFIEQHKNSLPFEFKILNYKPQKWTPQNSINVVGYIAWDLVMAWNNEITLYQIQQKLDSSLFKDFIPNFNSDSVIYTPTKTQNPQISNSLTTMGNTIYQLGIIPFMASNNWVVNGNKTKSGKPILCNDMHLGYNIPGIWYQAHLIVKNKMNVTGVLIPGEPVIVAGHNSDIAWGMTNVMLDGTDFYIETLNKDSTKYLLNGKWKNLKIVYEKIATKEGDTITLPLRYTHRGPIISKFKNIKNKAISMHWIGYEYSNEVAAVYKLNHAHNWQQFLDAVSNFGAVSQNIVYADKNGNIGIKLTGLIPKRKIPGFYVLPGDTTEYDWTGFIPFDSLPYEYNPKCGYIASANNKSSNHVNYYISQYYFQDYRYRRITEMLAKNDSITPKYMELIQKDHYSKMVQDFLPYLLKDFSNLKLNTTDYKKIMKYFKNWDADMAAQSIPALFFEQFNILFLKNTIENKIGHNLFQKVLSSKILSNNLLKELWTNKDPKLYDNFDTPNKIETKSDIIKQTFIETIDTLKSKLGDNVDNWQYARLHTLTLEHPLSKVKILNKIFNLNRGPYGVGGSNHTVSPYNYPYTKPFKVTSGASERHIFTLDNFDNSLTIIPTGESGIPASQFYCNQTDRYIADKYHHDYFSIKAIIENARYKMTFKKQ
jgi:penicillin amidase